MKSGWHNINDKKSWESFLDDNPDLGIDLLTQSYNWGLCFENLDQTVIRRLYYNNNKAIAGYTAVLEISKLYKFMVITGGPLMDFKNEELAKIITTDFKKIGKKYNCNFIRIRPTEEETHHNLKMLKKIGFKKSPIKLSVELTGLIDLNLNDEQLRANMSQSLRRKIRKAQADDSINIKVLNDDQMLDTFANLHLEHALKQNYKPFSKQRLIEQFKAFSKDDQALIYASFKEDKLLAANMMFFYRQQANYYFGVSTDLGKKYPSAPLLHLEAIKEARNRKISYYNFWGITKKNEIKHRYFGFSQFKRSFGIIEYQYVPAHDLVIKKISYLFIFIFETIRRKYRRL